MKVIRLMRAVVRRFRSKKVVAAVEPGRLAFASVSSEPGLLRRLPREQARRLAEQAGTMAQALITGAGYEPDGMQARSAASRVLRIVRDFAERDEVCGGSVDEMVRSAATDATDGLGGFLRDLDAELPRLADGAARLAMQSVMALGADGLRRLERARVERLMLAASRGAASALRGEPAAAATDGPDGSTQAALLIVEEVCAGWRTLPLPPVLGGDARARAEQLLELWRDATVCAGRPDAGMRARLWEDARDGHAFGAVWVMPAMLPMLVETDAERLAQDARSAAGFVLRRGSGQPGARGAMEAARIVLFACGQATSRMDRDGAGVVRPEAPPARAVHA